MSHFALITFKGEHREKLSKSNFPGYFLNWIRSIFSKPLLEEYAKKIELYEDLNVYIIRLPYYVDEISRYTGRLNKFITRFSADNSIKYCFLPKNIPDNIQLNGCFRFGSTGALLYKSALMNILDEIYVKRGIEVSELYICIVEGESRTELREVVDLLAPHVKYITIAAKDRNSVEAEMCRVYDDTGLSIRVTGEYRNCFKDSDLIINLGGLAYVAINSKINSNAVILNYSSDEPNKFSCENIVLNGFTVNVRGNIPHIIDNEVYKLYDETGIIETILLFKAGIEDKIQEEYIDKTMVKKLMETFYICGCSIKEFAGRRNKLKPQEIRI